MTDKMEVVFSDVQLEHAPRFEFHRGQSVPPFETVQRVDSIMEAIRDQTDWNVVKPTEHSIELLSSVHDAEYVSFLKNVWDEWAISNDGAILPHVWPAQTMKPKVPKSIFGRLGFYSFDAGSVITAGTWPAALDSARTAITAAEIAWQNQTNTFALCRPPGHHAERNAFGGYCYLNNAALAAEQLRQLGADRVAILDIDYHHGNGSQNIFYDRGDVLFASIHADPLLAYPYFSGYEDEIGRGEGAGANVNKVLADNTDWTQYQPVLKEVLQTIKDFHPAGLVVSFGADTYEADPISTFKLKSSDFLTMGQHIASLALPSVIVLEGGYAVNALGKNVVNFVSSFDKV